MPHSSHREPPEIEPPDPAGGPWGALAVVVCIVVALLVMAWAMTWKT